MTGLTGAEGIGIDAVRVRPAAKAALADHAATGAPVAPVVIAAHAAVPALKAADLKVVAHVASSAVTGPDHALVIDLTFGAEVRANAAKRPRRCRILR